MLLCMIMVSFTQRRLLQFLVLKTFLTMAGTCNRVPHQRRGPLQKLPARARPRGWVPGAWRPARPHGQPPVPGLPGVQHAVPSQFEDLHPTVSEGGIASGSCNHLPLRAEKP